jgi:hypothetical protein
MVIVDIAVSPDHDDRITLGKFPVIGIEVFRTEDEFIAVFLPELLESRNLVGTDTEADDFLFHSTVLLSLLRSDKESGGIDEGKDKDPEDDSEDGNKRRDEGDMGSHLLLLIEGDAVTDSNL